MKFDVMQPSSKAFKALQYHRSMLRAAAMLTGIRLRFLLGVICHVAGLTGCLRAHNERRCGYCMADIRDAWAGVLDDSKQAVEYNAQSAEF